MSKFFVKFEYNKHIKKIELRKEDLNWNNITKVLERAFFLSDKSQISLKYKDTENDEITVNTDQDLIEAYNTFFGKNLCKFFVNYSGVFVERPDKKQSDDMSKSSLIIMDTTQINENPKIVKENEKVQSEPISSSIQSTSSSDKPIEGKGDNVKVKIDPKELETIFTEVFSSTQIIDKIKHKLTNYIKEKQQSPEEDAIEYQIDTDYNSITQHMITSLNKIMNTKLESSVCVFDEKVMPKEEFKKGDFPKTAYNNIPLEQSVYEASNTLCSGGSSGDEKPLEKSRKSSDNMNNSISVSRDLTKSHGVKLVMKMEKGRAKFVSVPAGDLTASQAEKFSPLSVTTPYETMEKIEEENLAIDNVVLNLKRTASKDTKKKSDEFTQNLLKPNLHDLDDDLPAPYDKGKVEKFEKGVNGGSVFEKIN